MNRILIVDDHPLVREGMKKMLVGAKFQVDTAEDGEHALRLCRENTPPDLVITDIRMPGLDGFELATRLRTAVPGARVLMLAGMPLSHEIEKAKECGAAGYLPKSMPWRSLVAAINAILAGAAFQQETFAEERSGGPLSPRELETLKWLSEGKTREETAIILGIGIETVRTYTKNIMQKLDATNIPSSIRRAYEQGILHA